MCICVYKNCPRVSSLKTNTPRAMVHTKKHVMQYTLNPEVKQTLETENVCLTSSEVATLRQTLSAAQSLFSISENNVVGESAQIFWKISLIMIQHFNEYPNPTALQHYLNVMETFHEFLGLFKTVSEPIIDDILDKLR